MASRNRGQKKPKLRDLTRLPATDEDTSAMRLQLARQESPIVTAIIGQALVENGLEHLLRDHFTRRDDTTWAELTDLDGPLATFNSKIVSAYAFGICNSVVRDGLNTLRQIRNVFAHSKRPLDFDHELIKKALASVTLPQQQRSTLYKGLSAVRERATAPNERPRSSFIILCMVLETELFKKRAARLRAQKSHAERTYRNQLAAALLRSQPTPTTNKLAELSRSQSVDPSLLPPDTQQGKPDR